MQTPKYTSIDRVFSKFQRDYGINNVSDQAIIEWSGEALEAIGCNRLYQEQVAFIDVANFSCDVPRFLHAIVQVARDTQYEKKESTICPQMLQETVKESEENKENECHCRIYDECGHHVIDPRSYTHHYSFIELNWGFPLFANSNFYRQRFVPIRMTNNTMFDAIGQNSGLAKLFSNHVHGEVRDEYQVVNGDTLKFNFEKGGIALAYLKQQIDESTGYPLIPDEEIYLNAILSYVMLRISKRDFYNGREGAQAKMQLAESDWQWYCKRAKTQQMMPQTVDEYQNLLDQQKRMIWHDKDYYSFFGHTNVPENRNVQSRNFRYRR
ncbi:hypothetical protein FACS1894195_0120 [Bacteroidia bacterium]|nr:hypothetical protein FACS1894195_0120 [Bacteroidia bacterium]